MPPAEKRLYLDICTLKRPWDNQGQPRIAAETSAVLSLLDLVARGDVVALRSPAHDENARNSDPARARAVAAWLGGLPLPSSAPSELPARARALVSAGLTAFDALHWAWAESLGADALVTTDDRLVRRAKGRSVALIPILNPLTVLGDVIR